MLQQLLPFHSVEEMLKFFCDKSFSKAIRTPHSLNLSHAPFCRDSTRLAPIEDLFPNKAAATMSFFLNSRVIPKWHEVQTVQMMMIVEPSTQTPLTYCCSCIQACTGWLVFKSMAPEFSETHGFRQYMQ